MSLQFPQTPTGTLADLWRACLDLVPQIERKVDVVYAVTIGTASTPVQHGLPYIPKLAIPVPHADARVWRSADPDTTHVFFAASTSVVCDFLVVS